MRYHLRKLLSQFSIRDLLWLAVVTALASCLSQFTKRYDLEPSSKFDVRYAVVAVEEEFSAESDPYEPSRIQFDGSSWKTSGDPGLLSFLRCPRVSSNRVVAWCSVEGWIESR